MVERFTRPIRKERIKAAVATIPLVFRFNTLFLPYTY